jgi:hypothetical protein
VLSVGASNYVPHHRKIFYKFWWDQDMDTLKAASIESNLIWKAAGKPRHGPIFFINAKHIVYNTVRKSEKTKAYLKHLIQTTYTTHYSRKIVRVSGTVGNRNLSLTLNVVQSKVA